MNAIKLPVRAYYNVNHLWHVRCENDYLVCSDLSESDAKQIALALNSHDALVEALRFYALEPSECRNRLNPDLPGTRNDWNAEIGHDAGDKARDALAKAEELRKNTTKP